MSIVESFDHFDTDQTASSRTLHRALITYGSVTKLAAGLNVTVADLMLWMEGKEIPPHHVFLRALELAFVTEQRKLFAVKGVIQKYYRAK